jgi:hypothetical protein
MKLDTEFLRQHYAAMSDDELAATERADLVEGAQRLFDEEVARRKASESPRPSRQRYQPEAEGEPAEALLDEDSLEEDWLDDAAEAYSRYVARGTEPAPEAAQARDVLAAAGIPCLLELFEEPEQDEQLQYRWRVMVPGKLIHRAMSVLDRDIFNADFEAELKTHLELLSDEELRVMDPEYAFCGLYDRIERINRAYDEELERRQLK